MTLREATLADLPAIMQLERDSFPTDAWSEQTMRAEVDSEHNRYLVDDEDGRIVGYGGVRALPGGSDSDIQTIALASAFRGQGRGRMLLRALTTEAIARGARELFLEVRADNPVAESLYLSEGFTELGRRPRYYQPDDVDAVVMRLDLRAWAAHELQENARNAGATSGSGPAIRAISDDSGAGQESGARQESDAGQEAHA